MFEGVLLNARIGNKNNVYSPSLLKYMRAGSLNVPKKTNKAMFDDKRLNVLHTKPDNYF